MNRDIWSIDALAHSAYLVSGIHSAVPSKYKFHGSSSWPEYNRVKCCRIYNTKCSGKGLFPTYFNAVQYFFCCTCYTASNIAIT